MIAHVHYIHYVMGDDRDWEFVYIWALVHVTCDGDWSETFKLRFITVEWTGRRMDFSKSTTVNVISLHGHIDGVYKLYLSVYGLFIGIEEILFTCLEWCKPEHGKHKIIIIESSVKHTSKYISQIRCYFHVQTWTTNQTVGRLRIPIQRTLERYRDRAGSRDLTSSVSMNSVQVLYTYRVIWEYRCMASTYTRSGVWGAFRCVVRYIKYRPTYIHVQNLQDAAWGCISHGSWSRKLVGLTLKWSTLCSEYFTFTPICGDDSPSNCREQPSKG